MKKFTDHRTRVTRLLIRKAFTELLKQKPIQSISIRELCEHAGINRGTFYTHYTDIYDLLNQLEEEMQEEFEKALEPLLELDSGQFSPVNITTGIFQCLKDNSDLCTVTLGAYGDKSFAYKLLSLGREKCLDIYSQYFQAAPKKIDYFYVFASAGCIGILQKWLDEGMTSSAGEIAQMAESIMQKGIGFLQEDSDEV